MRASATHVSLLDTTAIHAKTDKPTEMSLAGEADSCGPKDHTEVILAPSGEYDLCGGGDAGCRYHYRSNLFYSDVSMRLWRTPN